jgi:uncharacterized protein
MLQFDLTNLSGARLGERLSFSLDEGPQQFDDIRVAFLRGWVRFTRVERGILIEASLNTQIEVECVRCLDPIPQPVKLEVEETIGLAGRPRPGIPYRLTEEGWFDVSPLFREQVWVALPMKPLCRPDCRGICLECGANLNWEACSCQKSDLDPRLAALADFLKKD